MSSLPPPHVPPASDPSAPFAPPPPPPSSPPPPPPPPPPTGGAPGGPPSGSWWRRKALLPVWAWIAVGVLLAGAIVVIVSRSGDDKGDLSTESANPSETHETAETESVETTAAPQTEASSAETSPPSSPDTEPPETTTTPLPSAAVVAGAPAGVPGSHAAPVPVGAIADLGDGWRLQILNVIADGSAAVAAESSFNDPPPPGSRFTLVEVVLGYFGLEDPKTPFETTISAVGANNTELPNDCGVIPDELDGYSDLFAGGVVSGNLCFVTAPADASALQLYAQANYFDGETTFLDASAAPVGAVAFAGLAGPQGGAAATAKRIAPVPIGTPTDLGEGWQLTVTGPATDITDAVLADSQYNQPPADGFRFVGVPLSYTYSGTESAAPYFVTLNAVAASNRQLGANCGGVPGELDQYSDVFAGGVVSGLLCWEVPAGQIGDLVLYGSASFDRDSTYFATD